MMARKPKEFQEKNYFDIVRESSREPEIVASVQGQRLAEWLVEKMDRQLTSEERASGTRHESKPATNVIASKLRIAKRQSTSRPKRRR
jgi:hypothetical protein